MMKTLTSHRKDFTTSFNASKWSCRQTTLKNLSYLLKTQMFKIIRTLEQEVLIKPKNTFVLCAVRITCATVTISICTHFQFQAIRNSYTHTMHFGA